MKFNVGDKVRITGDLSDCTGHLNGVMAIVIEVREADCRVWLDNGQVWFIWNWNLTLVEDAPPRPKFKIGDIVWINGTKDCYTDVIDGYMGKIVDIFNRGWYRVLVNYKLDDGSPWAIKEKDLTLVE